MNVEVSLSGTQLDATYCVNIRLVWRNAPYLHDGRAATIREVLVDFNKNGTHGKTGNLTDEELNCLLEYVLSL